MARGVNKVMILGNVGSDPDIRFLPSGNVVCNLRIATSDTWKDKVTGAKQEKTEWHSVVLFNKLGEIAQQYVHKGSKLYIEGKLQTRKWQGQDGTDRYSTEIVASDMQMLDGRSDGNSRAENQAQQYGMPQQQQAPQQQAPQQQAPQQSQQQQTQQFQRPQQNAYQQQSGGTVNGSQQMPNASDFDQEIPF